VKLHSETKRHVKFDPGDQGECGVPLWDPCFEWKRFRNSVVALHHCKTFLVCFSV